MKKMIISGLVLSLLVITTLLVFIPKPPTKKVVVISQPAPIIKKYIPKRPKESITKLKPKIIKKITIDSSRTIYINGPVGINMKTSVETLSGMDQPPYKPIFIVINSPGGSVLLGGLFLSQMEATKSPIITICHGLCASMAAIILQYGDKRYAVDKSIIMFHPASGGAQGDVDRMSSLMNMLQSYIFEMEHYVSNRIGLEYSEYKAKSAVEWWLTTHQAKDANVIDKIVIYKTKHNLLGNIPLFYDLDDLGVNFKW